MKSWFQFLGSKFFGMLALHFSYSSAQYGYGLLDL
jgi:hypothetical protein